uniref:Uncharacterized protein n=1 Tax=Arundo donax TaxID=35708 RepID=A0A0A9DLC9_ARUDO
MRFDQILRFTVKFSLAVAWAIILPIFYASSQNYKACSAKRYKTFLGMFCLSKYMVVVALYLASNVSTTRESGSPKPLVYGPKQDQVCGKSNGPPRGAFFVKMLSARRASASAKAWEAPVDRPT